MENGKTHEQIKKFEPALNAHNPRNGPSSNLGLCVTCYEKSTFEIIDKH